MDVKDVTKENLADYIRCKLNGYLSEKGGIFYSSHETICKGEVYLMGVNPGGEGGTETLKACLNRKMKDGKNELLDERWGEYRAGEHPLQKYATWLLGELDLEPREVFATNLIFMQSKDSNNTKVVNMHNAKICWLVHEALLKNIVRPRVILAFGNDKRPYKSPYGYMRTKYNGEGFKELPQKPNYEKEYGLQLKGFLTDKIIPGQDVFVAGIPHLSRYKPNHKTIDWINHNWPHKNQQV